MCSINRGGVLLLSAEYLNRSCPTDRRVYPCRSAHERVSSPSAPSGEIGQAPEGGLGNDILRNNTWQYVAAAAQGRGCDQPLGADTKTEVLQEPQNGVWTEKWNVARASGDSYPFEVIFTLDATGATFNIKSLP
jgi:hypothetical protein